MAKTMSSFSYYRKLRNYIKTHHPDSWEGVKGTFKKHRSQVLHCLDVGYDISYWFCWNNSLQGGEFWKNLHLKFDGGFK